MSSLPVPVSPINSTVESVSATISMLRKTFCIRGGSNQFLEVQLPFQLLLKVEVLSLQLLQPFLGLFAFVDIAQNHA